MSELQIFKNAEFGSIRTLTINGEPYFVGRDVAEILGYSNSRKALADHVDEEDKGVTKCDTLGGTQEMTVINESGLYSLILAASYLRPAGSSVGLHLRFFQLSEDTEYMQ